MSGSIIRTIVRKDVAEFLRNQFFVFMTVLVLIVWVVVYWLLPDSVDENIAIGVHLEGFELALPATDQDGGVGLTPIVYDSPAELRSAVEDGTDDVVAGIAVPAGFAEAVAAGEQPTVEIFVPAGLGDDERLLVEGLVDGIAFALAGEELAFGPRREMNVLGVDRVRRGPVRPALAR